MRRRFRIALAFVVGLSLAGYLAYRVWFHNPYEDALYLDAASIFAEEVPAAGLLISNATLIDVEAGRTVPNAQILIRGDRIVELLVGEEHELPAGASVYDAQGKFVMPGLVDTHVHLAMHWRLLSGEFGPRDALVECLGAAAASLRNTRAPTTELFQRACEREPRAGYRAYAESWSG